MKKVELKMQLKKVDIKTLVFFVVVAFLTQGSSDNGCGDGTPILDSNGAANGASHLNGVHQAGADPNAPNQVAGDPNGADPNGNGSGDNGTANAGDECSSDNQCGGGQCVGGSCEATVPLRISLVWEVQQDIDLHVITPSGEELYYRNREGAYGGRFSQDGCLQTRCDEGTNTEMVKWNSTPNEGTYEIYAVNYGGGQAVNFQLDILNEGQRERFQGSVGASAGARSGTVAITVGGSTGTGELQISSHRHETWHAGTNQTFTVDTENDDIDRVQYVADGQYDLGSSTRSPNFSNAYNFNSLGEHKIEAKGYGNGDFELDNHEITIVVTDNDGGLPNPGQGAVVSEKLLAKKILEMGGISLYNIQVSGRNDGADSRSNMTASSNGSLAANSSYGNAPGGRTRLNPKMLQAMYLLNQVHGYTFRVTSIAGGSHSAGSQHYYGHAFDVDTINGRSVSGNPTLARQFEAQCAALGASLVLGPGDAGHSTHVHCQWN